MTHIDIYLNIPYHVHEPCHTMVDPLLTYTYLNGHRHLKQSLDNMCTHIHICIYDIFRKFIFMHTSNIYIYVYMYKHDIYIIYTCLCILSTADVSHGKVSHVQLHSLAPRSFDVSPSVATSLDAGHVPKKSPWVVSDPVGVED